MLERNKCQATQRLPKYGRQQVSVQQPDERVALACWMGPDCGWQEMPDYYGAPTPVKVA